MKLIIIALAAGTLGLAACGTTVAEAPAAPTVTRTATPPMTPASPSASSPAAAPPSDPNVTDPWAVVSAYYGDVESRAYPGSQNRQVERCSVGGRPRRGWFRCRQQVHGGRRNFVFEQGPGASRQRGGQEHRQNRAHHFGTSIPR